MDDDAGNDTCVTLICGKILRKLFQGDRYTSYLHDNGFRN